jgi:hypothetical protein
MCPVVIFKCMAYFASLLDIKGNNRDKKRVCGKKER